MRNPSTPEDQPTAREVEIFDLLKAHLEQPGRVDPELARRALRAVRPPVPYLRLVAPDELRARVLPRSRLPGWREWVARLFQIS